MLLIKSYLAAFYYNIEQAGSYDISNYEDRQRAERNFSNKKVFDEKILEQAYKEYLEMLASNFQDFKNSRLRQ